MEFHEQRSKVPSRYVTAYSSQPTASRIKHGADLKDRPLQRLNGDFLKKTTSVVAVILQAEPAFVGTRAAFGVRNRIFFSGTGWPSV